MQSWVIMMSLDTYNPRILIAASMSYQSFHQRAQLVTILLLLISLTLLYRNQSHSVRIMFVKALFLLSMTLVISGKSPNLIKSDPCNECDGTECPAGCCPDPYVYCCPSGFCAHTYQECPGKMFQLLTDLPRAADPCPCDEENGDTLCPAGCCPAPYTYCCPEGWCAQTPQECP